MKIDEMQKGIDDFIKELFYGITTYYILTESSKRIEVTTNLLKMTAPEENKDRLVWLFDNLHDYLDQDKNEPELTRKIYKTIMNLRAFGVFINNPDAITSLKIEKINAENRNQVLQFEKNMLAQEVLDLRKILDQSRTKNPMAG